jgi:hypothetical protein
MVTNGTETMVATPKTVDRWGTNGGDSSGGMVKGASMSAKGRGASVTVRLWFGYDRGKVIVDGVATTFEQYVPPVGWRTRTISAV